MPRALSRCTAIGGIVALLGLAAPGWAAAPIDGQWYTKGKRAVVTIAPCGKAICGRITRFIVPPDNGVTTDVNNPDHKLRNRKLLGLTVLSGFTADGAKWRGHIYDPESGNSYRSVVTPLKDGNLKVEGCIAFFCRGETWTPVK